MSVLKELLAEAVGQGASDVHLKPGRRPFYRLHGALVESSFTILTPEIVEGAVRDILPHHLSRDFESEMEADFSHMEEGVGRFRVNVFVAQGSPAIVFRHVKQTVPTLDELNLPTQLKDLVSTPHGIVIISGSTGTGKSTTLAALVQQLNVTQPLRIVTIEDPIEYQFEDALSVITQREVGLDTLSFHAALKRVMRQDPDVIMIGEMRDETTFATAMTAAETGHLVLTTLHAGTASQAVNRILDLFATDEREQVRLNIASNLRAIVCQALIPAVQGGVVPAVEIMINTPTVRKLIAKDRLEVLSAAIETGQQDGMQTFNQAVYKLIKGGVITEAEGMRHAGNPGALKMNLQGIFLDEASRILSTA